MVRREGCRFETQTAPTGQKYQKGARPQQTNWPVRQSQQIQVPCRHPMVVQGRHLSHGLSLVLYTCHFHLQSHVLEPSTYRLHQPRSDIIYFSYFAWRIVEEEAIL